ncbi:MAG: flagellar hook-length control protein FliK [Mobilitalea sp.]
MTQSVKFMTGNTYSSDVRSVNTKEKQVGNSFDLLMNQSMKSRGFEQGNATEAVNKKYDKKESTEVKKSTDDTSAANENQTVDEPATKVETKETQDSSQSDKAAATGEETKVTQPETEVKDVDEQLEDQALGMLQAIFDAVMKTLNLTEENLNQLLQEQGMTAADLLSMEGLQKIVLANSGQTSLLAFATEEGLTAQLQELLQKVEELQADTNISLTKEQLDALLLKNKLENQGQQAAAAESIDSYEQVSSDHQVINQSEAKNAAVSVKTEIVADSDSQVNSQAVQLNVSKEESLASQQDGGKHEAKDSKASNHFQNFVDQMVQVTKELNTGMDGTITQVTQLRDIANQIVDRIRITMTTDQTSMEMQLNPENLGKVNLSVQSKNGVMTAHFVVQNEISKEAIESQMHILRESLQNQGIKVEAIEVTVSNQAFEQMNQNNSQNEAAAEENHSGKKITLEEALSMNEILEEINELQEASSLIGSQVDYSA